MTDTHALGLQRAEDAANRAGPHWKAAAYQAFVEYAKRNKSFTTEEVRKAFPDLPPAPDQRAWGAIAQSAQKSEIVEAIGWKRAVSSNGRAATLWQSNLI